MKRLRAWIHGWLDSPRAPWVILALTLLVTLPSIRVGFYNDDHPFRAALHGQWPGGPAWWNLYRFATPATNETAIENGILPWWTAPGLKIHLLRPLSSVLFAADDAVFGDAPLGYHLHSLAWYLVLVAAVGRLQRALLGRVSGNFAMLIFALATAHFYPYAWPSCRHAELAAIPVVLGLGSWVADPRHGRFLLALGLAVGLACGESALGVLPFALAFAAFDARPTRERIRDLAPALVVGFAYLGLYAALGCGASQSDGYVDPIGAPGRFAARAAVMLPAMIGNATLGVPAELANLGITTPLVLLGVVGMAWFTGLARSVRAAISPEERAALLWLVPGALVAILPGLGGFPGARTLLLPNLGFAALVAVLVRRAFAEPRVLPKLFAAPLVLIHVVLPPLIDLGNADFTAKTARAVDTIGEQAELDPEHRRVFFLGSSDPMLTMYAPTVVYEKWPERLGCWSVLSGTKGTHRFTRTGPSSFTLRPNDGPFVRGAFETLFRTRALPMAVGDTSHQCGATFVVTEVEGSRPRAIEVTLDVPLEALGVRLVVWKDGRLRAFVPPAVGESAELPAEPGPLGAF